MKLTFHLCILSTLAAVSLAFAAEQSPPKTAAEPAKRAAAPAKPAAFPPGVWVPLFDGKTLGNWKPSDFPPNGKIEVKDGLLKIGMGEPMSGITWRGELPARMNYEIELEAMRTEGHDFFCGLTFPVGKDPCSLICGGWGGSVVGLSSIDGLDASENTTTTTEDFENNRWYKIKVRVTKQRVEAWIDGELIVNQELEGHEIGIRWEVEPSVPLGIATWLTGSALRNIRWRNLD